ncbi:hypothetical protein [Mycolicibacterium celeriflavum]|uniref:hypothetical protein n=1 Tax=Mycolicibacterium celeriflavum TaxID=1249101 RepID=UPI003CE6A017
MTDHTLTTDGSPASDWLATSALLLHVVALLASTACLAAFLVGHTTVAIAAGVLAVLHLVGARATLVVDGSLERRRLGRSARPLGEYALAGGTV